MLSMKRLKLIKCFTVTLAVSIYLLAVHPLYASYEPPIRVALIIEVQFATVTSSDGMELRELRNGTLIEVIDAGQSVSFTNKGNEIKSSTGHKKEAFALYPLKGFLIVSGKEYRGAMNIAPDGDGISVVDVLPMEEYLRGVVPCEVPASWHVEALKAQAVAARTYAVNRLGQFEGRPFDVYGTVADQAYGGVGREYETTDEAIRATRGLVMTYEGEAIIAYFSASAGGCSTDPFDSKGYKLPYLRSVISPDEDSNRWTIEITSDELSTTLKSAGKDIGKPLEIQIKEFAPSGKIITVQIMGKNGVTTIRATELRKLLGYGRLKSTRFCFGANGVLPPITVSGADEEAGGRIVREVFQRIIMKLGSGHYPVLCAEGVVDTRLGLAVVLGSAGMSYLGSESYAAGYETSYAQFPEGLGSEAVEIDPEECLESYKIGGSVIFRGTGYGHGIGMSQHGAKAFADMGWDYRQILQHYYYHIDLTVMYE